MSAWAPGTRKCNEENDSTPSLSLKVPCRSEATSSGEDRKSTRLNSSHSQISYAVFCLKKKNNKITRATNPKTFTSIDMTPSVNLFHCSHPDTLPVLIICASTVLMRRADSVECTLLRVI